MSTQNGVRNGNRCFRPYGLPEPTAEEFASMKIGLRIGDTATSFIRKMLADEPEESALVIAAFVRGSHERHSMEASADDVLSNLIERASQTIEDLPVHLICDYYISTKALTRLLVGDLHEISGIKCYLPTDLIVTIGDREILVEDGELQFRPPLPPLEIDRSRG